MSNQKQSQTKTIILFIATLFASLILGFICGTLLRKLNPALIRDWTTQNATALCLGTTIAFAASNLLLFLIAFIPYLQCRRTFRNNPDAEDTVLDSIERRLDYSMLWSNIAMILNFAFFGISLAPSITDHANRYLQLYTTPVTLVIFVLGFVWIIAIQNAIVKFIQQMNPEKQGSVFDMKFQKKWVNSCDEGQKLILYQASYTAFRITNGVCLALWLITFLCNLTFHTGVFPLLCVCVIYLASIVSYTVRSMQLEHR